jgi:hypothetical protein
MHYEEGNKLANLDEKGNPILSKTIAGTMFLGSDNNEVAMHTTAATAAFAPATTTRDFKSEYTEGK